ncbi:MAG: hypothetical protein LBD14_02185 [Puniceicoccales bacterium]|jgi:hypothetical protein|nr:hypothetical protein [Puniceicoccales bacterium]
MSTELPYTSYAEYENTLIEQARKEALEKWKEVELRQRLATAYQSFGFSSNAEFIKALGGVVRAGGKGKGKGKGKPPAGAPKKKGPKKGKRVRLTPEIIAKIRELSALGKGVSEITRTLGISAPSVYKVTKNKS